MHFRGSRIPVDSVIKIEGESIILCIILTTRVIHPKKPKRHDTGSYALGEFGLPFPKN